jgi:hypothetical protein
MFVQQGLNKLTYKIRSRKWKTMMIVGQVSSPEEAKEMEFIAKALVVGNRARVLALKVKVEGAR